MKKILSIAAIIFLITSCANKKLQSMSGMPPCLISKVEGMKSPAMTQPQSVTEYTYKGEIVFYITSGCCDQYNPVYNSNCDYLGAPDGGITGKGDGKIADFYANATNKKVVWQNK